VGNEYRLELIKRFVQGPHTDLTVYFSDLTKGGRHKIGTMRYPGEHIKSRNVGGFLEQASNDQYTCLDTDKMHIVVKDVRYSEAGSFSRMDDVRVVAGNGCANTWYGLRDDGLHLSSGGPVIGFPVLGQLGGVTMSLQKQTGDRLNSCFNGLKDGDETAADCGGSCARQCEACYSPCAAKRGTNLTCCDGIWNGDEEYVDCGGNCGPCEMGSNVQFLKIHDDVGMSWDNAKTACEKQGFTLASIRNRFENIEAEKACGSSCWIGVHREGDCNTPLCWSWPDGLRLEETAFNHWGYPGHPNLYKDGFTFVKITQAGKGSWVPVKRADTIKDVLCSRRTPDPWMDKRVLETKVLRVRASKGKWMVTETQLFYDTACQHALHVSLLEPDSQVTSLSWLECADSHKLCRCEDGLVRYGSMAAQKWSEPIIAKNGSAQCNVDTFGDPAHGDAKSCYCAKFVESDAVLLLRLKQPVPVGCVRLTGSMKRSKIILETCEHSRCDSTDSWRRAPTISVSISIDGVPASSRPRNLGLHCVTIGGGTQGGASAVISGCVCVGIDVLLWSVVFGYVALY